MLAHVGASTSQPSSTQQARALPEGLDWEPLDLTAEGTDIQQLLRKCK